jgi:hypothetical protein
VKAALLVLLFSCGLGPPALAASSKSKQDPEAVKLVELFLKAQVADLPPDSVPYFLAIDTATLPDRLLHPFLAKRLELLTLKRLAEGERKGNLRRYGEVPEENCGDADVLTEKALKLLRDMGFVERKDEEVAFLMKETNCTECELRTEFSLTVIQLEPKPGRKKPPVRFFFQAKDPILALLVNFRNPEKYGSTSFFGIGGKPKCRY